MGDRAPRSRVGGGLGRCPECAGVIPTDHLLIRYRQAGDWPVLIAECPACTVVVHPR